MICFSNEVHLFQIDWGKIFDDGKKESLEQAQKFNSFLRPVAPAPRTTNMPKRKLEQQLPPIKKREKKEKRKEKRRAEFLK